MTLQGTFSKTVQEGISNQWRAAKDIKAFLINPKPRLPNHEVPNPFRDSQRDRTSRANKTWPSMLRALRTMKKPCLYSLSLTEHLGLAEHFQDSAGLFDHATIEIIKSRLKKRFIGCFWYAIEVGENERLHVHIIASFDAGFNELSRDKEQVKPIKAGTEFQVLKYLLKEAPANQTLLDAYQKAIKTNQGRFAKVRGFCRLERIKTTNLRAMWIKPEWKKNVQNLSSANSAVRPMRRVMTNTRERLEAELLKVNENIEKFGAGSSLLELEIEAYELEQQLQTLTETKSLELN